MLFTLKLCSLCSLTRLWHNKLIVDLPVYAGTKKKGCVHFYIEEPCVGYDSHPPTSAMSSSDVTRYNDALLNTNVQNMKRTSFCAQRLFIDELRNMNMQYSCILLITVLVFTWLQTNTF